MRFARLEILLVLALALALPAGCTTSLRETGKEPALTSPGQVEAEMLPVSATPVPSQQINPHSTWTDSASYLFASKRPPSAGDIITVRVSISDKAQLSNKTNRARDGAKSIGLAGSFDVAGTGSSGQLDASLKNATNFSGTGGTTRSEAIDLQITAVIVGFFPNGNVFIRGTQEVRVNAELRLLMIEGIVRPSDIEVDNSISYDRIAEARFSYGGRGRISEVQQPAFGQQILDRISPL